MRTKKLSDILKASYEDTEGSPSLLLINDPDIVNGPKVSDPTKPPIPNLSTYPFLSKGLEELGSFLDSVPTDFPISTYYFLVADKRTIEDDSLLFVGRSSGENDEQETVRLASEYANKYPIAVQVGTLGINELRSSVDEDGVYRGGPADRPPPKKGGKAPRKELGR
jgi:hypothetical protein